MAADTTSIAEDAVIGNRVEFGYGTVVKSGVRIGDGCVIEDQVVLGKVPRRRRRQRRTPPALGPLVLGTRVTVCTGAVVFAGAVLADDVIVGDQAFIRERAQVGAETRVGRGTCVDNDVVIGRRCSIQTMAYLTANSIIEDDVFIGPCAITTNDEAMGRRSPTNPLRGATLRRACRIGGGVVLTPGVEIGEEAFIAAGSLVTRDVPPRTAVRGVPAKAVRRVPEQDLLENWQ